jgi:hypothetical protein
MVYSKSITIEGKGHQIGGDIPNTKAPNTHRSKFLDSGLEVPRLKRVRHPQKIVTQIPKEGVLLWGGVPGGGEYPFRK